MITLGAKFGGPETLAFERVWRRIALAVGEVRSGDVAAWKGIIPSVNVVFYIPGSVLANQPVKGIEAARFSRKRKMLLVNVPVPTDLRDDFDKSFSFILESLHRANTIAAEVFAKKGDESFDLAKAEEIVNRAAEYLTDAEFRARVDAKISPRAERRYPPLTGFSDEAGWSLVPGQQDGRPRFIRINSAAKLIQGHPDLPCRLGVVIPILRPNAQGLPAREESYELDTIEEAMIGELRASSKGFMVAVVTCNAIREFMFYVQSPESAEAALAAARAKSNGHQIRPEVKEDREWNAYRQIGRSV